MFRIGICEDCLEERSIVIEKAREFFEKANLRYSIREYSSGNGILAEIEDGTAAFDLILMDIHLGSSTLNGFETAVRIRKLNQNVPIAFLTASRDYAVESYDVDAVAYLLKPVQEEKLFALFSKLSRAEVPKCLSVKRRGCTKILDYRDILYMESSGHRVVIHLHEKGDEVVYYKLDELENALCDERFIRCHKSFLVNMDYVTAADKEFTLAGGFTASIRTHGRKAIIQKYNEYFKRKNNENK